MVGGLFKFEEVHLSCSFGLSPMGDYNSSSGGASLSFTELYCLEDQSCVSVLSILEGEHPFKIHTVGISLSLCFPISHERWTKYTLASIASKLPYFIASIKRGVICTRLMCGLALSNKDRSLVVNNVTLPSPLAKSSESNALSFQTSSKTRNTFFSV